MLSSLYKAHDPLAAEFFRTCRHEFFYGKQFLLLYEALKAGEPSREGRVTLSSKNRRPTATDAQSLYGFRPRHEDTFFVSPWEFVQWFWALRLKCPSASYPYSKWTSTGRMKRSEMSTGPNMVAGEDYEFDFAKIRSMAGVYAFPNGKDVFDEAVPDKYKLFRLNWILRWRTRPMVPCAETRLFPVGEAAKMHAPSSSPSI